MKTESGRLLGLAGAVADGSAIDWHQLEGETRGADERHLVEQLRLIAQIAELHRSPADPGANRTAASLSRSDGREEKSASDAVTGVGRWGDLVLIEEVGEGAFGVVYRAHDPTLDRPVALKVLRQVARIGDTQLVTKHLLEARTLARVRHPNVVTVYGAGEYDGQLGLWMEFVRGLTLEQMLRAHGPFSAAEATLVGHEISGALAAVHLANLVHRDIKAQNVMREEGGRLVLMDFGTGLDQGEPNELLGRIAGTPLYLAPEVMKGEPATRLSDIYSLGVLLYHLVTNDFPLKRATLADLIEAHSRGEAVPLTEVRPHLSTAFVRLVERAIDPVAERRFSSAGRMQAALAQILGSGANRVAAPRIRTSAPSKRRAVRTAPGHDSVVPSVAVLPFTDMSAAKDQECFCDGIAEELISALAQIPGLRVAARTSAFRFKGQARDVRRIGNALNVATILDGSVRKEQDQLRITVELIGAKDGYHLWSRRFDRSLQDVFAVQDEIATSIVETLKGKLTRDDGVAAHAHRSRDLDAYASYLEGRYHWNKRTEDELKKSVTCFEQTISRDPDFAPAHAALADAYFTLGTYGCIAARDVMGKATDAIDRALTIDGRLAEAYACRGCVRAVHDWAWAEAERDFERAITLMPGYPTAHHWYAMNLLVPMRRFEEATTALRRALTLDPLALAIRMSVGMLHYFAARYDEAAAELSKTVDLEDSFGMAHLFLGATYTEQAKYPEAHEELQKAIRHAGRTPEILAALGYLHGVSGNADAARNILDELTRLRAERYVSPERLAEVHSGLGERADVFERLEEARTERSAELAWLAVRPVFARLKGEPDFGALLSTMGLSPF